MNRELLEKAHDFVEIYDSLARKDPDSIHSIFFALYTICFGLIDPENRSAVFSHILMVTRDLGSTHFEDSEDVVEYLQGITDEWIRETDFAD